MADYFSGDIFRIEGVNATADEIVEIIKSGQMAR